MFPVSYSTTQTTINCSRTCFATHGLPQIYASHYGSYFTSKEFERFLKRNGILHINSEMQLNSSVTVYSPSQNISNPSTEKQLRKQIYNIPKSANNNLQEHQPEETNPRSSKRGSNSNIALR